MDAVAVIAAVISFFAFLATASQAQSAKAQAEIARGQAQDSQTQANTAKQHAEAAQKQVDVARQHVEVANEQLRILKEDREAEAAKARVAQANQVFLEPGAGALGASRGGRIESRAQFALTLKNESSREILKVTASIKVARLDGEPESFKFHEARLNPGSAINRMVTVTGRPDEDPALWTASTYAEFTDAGGRRWLIDDSGMRINQSA